MESKTKRAQELETRINELETRLIESEELERKLRLNLDFWKRHYYNSQSQLTQNGIVPDIHVRMLGGSVEKYLFYLWEVEQMANSKLKVKLSKAEKKIAELTQII